jgi:predicted nucleotidyltransferase
MMMKHDAARGQRDVTRPTEIAREVARLARTLFGGNAEVVWFGSWPQGKALAHSDIDLAVSTGAPIPPERMALLQEAVDEVATLYQVDIIDLNSVGPALREEILKHGERL